jgi:hypothetical protein
MPQIDLTDAEHAALVELLTETIEADRFPLSPRIKMLRQILVKFGIGSAPAMPYPGPSAECSTEYGPGENAPAATTVTAVRCPRYQYRRRPVNQSAGEYLERKTPLGEYH